ncbi:hypothetical protein ACFOWX_01795 [Sphingorhabdus arenilitoris]|uniref:GP-PDE domain-containing protein n=1 Tax=Sphingorhabdus arenilitoris TaxID=1490041 RepID=A0ABV8RE30_9SPHN
MSPKWGKRLLLAVALLIFGFTLFHASWLAPDPTGRPKLVASGPIDLPRDAGGCAIDAAAGYGAASVSQDTQMLQSAAGSGADGIVINSEMVDGTPVVPRIFGKDCKAVTPRTPIAEAMTALSKPDQFIHVNSASDAAAIQAAVSAQTAPAEPDGPKRIFFAAKDADIQRFDKAAAFSVAKARQCAGDYRTSGMAGIVPSSCVGGTMILTLDDLGMTLWGWPDRFMARMAAHNVRLIIAADEKDGKLTGLTQLTQYNDIANSYNGYIWVDNIAELGPALKR